MPTKQVTDRLNHSLRSAIALAALKILKGSPSPLKGREIYSRLSKRLRSQCTKGDVNSVLFNELLPSQQVVRDESASYSLPARRGKIKTIKKPKASATRCELCGEPSLKGSRYCKECTSAKRAKMKEAGYLRPPHAATLVTSDQAKREKTQPKRSLANGTDK